MSNRDGRGAKHNADHKTRRLKEGSPCPTCVERGKAHRRSKVKLDNGGHATVSSVRPAKKLKHCPCGCRRKGSNNLVCPACHWSNF